MIKNVTDTMMGGLLRAIELEEVLFDKEYRDEVIEKLDFNRLELESVRFINCRLIGCDLSGCVFKQVSFEKCDLSNLIWKNGYFRDITFTDCKGDGSDFGQSSFINAVIEGGTYHYGNFSATLWDNSEILNTEFGDSFFSEAKFKKIRFDNVNLIRSDFFKTVLKGIDLSTCIIDGIMVSDTFREIKGVRLNAEQAVVIAQMLGVKFI